MRAYLLGLATAGVFAVQALDANSPAYFVTVWGSIGLAVVALFIRKAGK